MPFVRSAKLSDLASLTAEVHEFLAQPGVQPGVITRFSPDLASRVYEEVLARSAEDLLEARRRERESAPEVLAFRVS